MAEIPLFVGLSKKGKLYFEKLPGDFYVLGIQEIDETGKTRNFLGQLNEKGVAELKKVIC